MRLFTNILRPRLIEILFWKTEIWIVSFISTFMPVICNFYYFYDMQSYSISLADSLLFSLIFHKFNSSFPPSFIEGEGGGLNSPIAVSLACQHWGWVQAPHGAGASNYKLNWNSYYYSGPATPTNKTGRQDLKYSTEWW